MPMKMPALRTADGALAPEFRAANALFAGDDFAARAEQRADLIRFEIIQTAAQLETIASEWNALYELNPRPSVAFHQFHRLLHWIETAAAIGAHSELAIVLGRRQGRLVLAAPFVIEYPLGRRQLVWAGEPMAQYGDILVDPINCPAGAPEALLRFTISALRPDVIRLRRVRSDAAISPFLARMGAWKTGHQEAPYLDLTSAPTAERYEERYSAKAKRNRRRLLRRLQSEKTVTFNTIEPGAHAARVARAALALKRAWLTSRRAASLTLDGAGIDKWLAAMAANPAAQCRVTEVRCNGELAAAQIGFRDGERLALYLIVFNISFERDGIGSLHLEQTIRDCYAEGIERIDLLAPNVDYKMKWADGADGLDDYVLPLTLAGWVCACALHPTVRNAAKQTYIALPASARSIVQRIFGRG
jgi:CelD/BcsL family acetyltransferase involved in cellulose biosynthesis